jgi:hypothetical protein
VVHNVSTAARTAVVRSRAYLKYPTDRLTLAPGGKTEVVRFVAASSGWYDLEVTDAHDGASPAAWKAASRRSATR